MYRCIGLVNTKLDDTAQITMDFEAKDFMDAVRKVCGYNPIYSILELTEMEKEAEDAPQENGSQTS